MVSWWRLIDFAYFFSKYEYDIRISGSGPFVLMAFWITTNLKYRLKHPQSLGTNIPLSPELMVQQSKRRCLMNHRRSTLPETNSSHLKIDGWKTIVSFWGPWDGLFSGATLCSGNVLPFSSGKYLSCSRNPSPIPSNPTVK